MTQNETATQKSSRQFGWHHMPEIDLRQLLRLTDDTGMFQHGVHLLPDPTHGYCIDDNCRALLAAVLHADLRGHDEDAVPLQRYLAFVAYGYNPDNGWFRNFMGYNRDWLEEAGSQDSHARTLWSLGVTVQRAPTPAIEELAEQLFLKGLGAVEQMKFIRPWTYSLLGLHAYLEARPDHEQAKRLRRELTDRMYAIWREHAADDWPWWEDELTWGNAKLPHAMLINGYALDRDDIVEAALKALRWCIDVQTASDGHLTLIGNDGWFVRGREPAQFDQQPIEAQGIVQAALAAAAVTGDESWCDDAWRGFHWFRGFNDLGLPLYHPETGGAQDGLRPDGVNKNQGAESVLAYLLSVLELHLYRERVRRAGTGDSATGQVTAEVTAAPRTIGVGVIGAGGFADFCLRQWRGLEHYRPVAVWSRTADHARRFADQYELTMHERVEALVADDRVDLVYVATTPDQHAPYALAALRAGRHVLVDKPPATTRADARRLIDAAVERDRVLAVNLMMRHGPLFEPIRELIASQALGAMLRGTLINCAGDAGLPADHWFWDPKRSGGIFIEHGVHFFDLFRGWLGDGQVLHAHALRRPDRECIDQVAAELQYGPQTTVSQYHGFHQVAPLDRQTIRLIFERGELTLSGWVARTLTLRGVVSDADAERLEALPPGGDVRTVRRFDPSTPLIHRGRQVHADREIELRWQADADGEAVYGAALRGLLADAIRRIHHPSHEMRVSARDGLAAVTDAAEATRLAGLGA